MAVIPYETRTDGVSEKVRLLEAAYAAGKYDLAMSLVESIKDTLQFERLEKAEPPAAAIITEQFAEASGLPHPWAGWARGWSYYKPIVLCETVGIKRLGEPVDLGVAFRSDQTTDLHREVRVARVDDGSVLREVPSQVYDEVRRGSERGCRLVFFADVPAHAEATYLILYGNSYAELPRYDMDLRASGEDYRLDIENVHYIARLSRQMGQLERLTYKREHGLELYAGGKGHGEPPTIDWAHDYVDQGHFQKLRMRNWPHCPNHAIVTGPLCARVRRWGFPYSPIHPLFTPSRMHMDITYVFYAGLPYFLKEGQMDMVKPFPIEAMRDDEWVFSGYSFTDTLWMDSTGKLHEGSVPAEQSSNLWGVGYFHRLSHDAFMALWLEHSAEKFRDPDHSGVPMLHYRGHGHVWSRYPAQGVEFQAGASIRQRNAYVVLPYPDEVTMDGGRESHGRGETQQRSSASERIQRLRHQLINPLEVRTEWTGRAGDASSRGTLARAGETPETAPLKSVIWKALAQVRDEQLYKADANIVDMGYVYDVRVRDGVATVLVTMPHRGRPVYEFLATQGGGRVEEGIRERLLKLDGIRDVVVAFTWNPPWTVARLSDAGRRQLGLQA